MMRRPLAEAVSTTAVRPPSVSRNDPRTGLPRRPVTVMSTSSPPRIDCTTAAVPSPPSASGHLTATAPAARTPFARAPAPTSALIVPLNESGATTTIKKRPQPPGRLTR